MGTRTPDLLTASQALYQLSYSPVRGSPGAPVSGARLPGARGRAVVGR